MSFSNPVTGGQGALIRPAIKSPNYSPGVTGWTINRDGSAEFNNLTIRGTFFGTSYILNTAGAFFYNGTPAAGNLILSIAAVAGTDSFGNAYFGGFNVGNQQAAHFGVDTAGRLYVVNSTGGQVQFTDSATGSQTIGLAAAAHWLFDVAASQFSMFDLNAVLTARLSASVGNSNFLWLSNLAKQFFLINGGTVQIGSLTTAGSLPTAADTANAASLSLQLGTANSLTVRGQSNTAAPGNVVPLVVLQGGNTGNTVPGNANNPQLQVKPSAGAAIDIALTGGALYRADLSGWQIPTPATNWALGDTGGSFAGLQYCIDGEDNLKAIGAVHMTLAAGLVAGTYSIISAAIPATYRPAQSWNVTAIHCSTANVVKAAAQFRITSAGLIQITTSTAIAQNDNFYLTATVPLGHLP